MAWVDFRRGLRRVQFSWALGAATFIFILTVGMADLRTWGGSPYLVLARQISSAPHILIPWCVGLGAVIGQARWRAGLFPWDMETKETRRRTLRLSINAALSAVLVPIVAAVIVLSFVAAWGAVGDGISYGTIAAEIVSGLWRVVIALITLAGVTVFGATLGWKFQPTWLTPVAVLASLLLVISGMTAFTPSELPDRTVASPRQKLVCLGDFPRVCAIPGNAAYLDAAVSTVGDFYDSSPVKDGLPESVLLVDTYSGLPWKQIDDIDSTAIVAIGAQRGATAPDRLDAKALEEQLVDSMARHCNAPLSPEYLETAKLLHTGNSNETARLKELTRC